MNAKERKYRIKYIIEQLIEGKQKFKTYKEKIKLLFTKLDDLDCLISESGLESNDIIDVPEIRVNILLAFISETEFEKMFEHIEEFKNDLADYIEELSNSKQEAMDEKYEEFDNIEDFIDYGSFESYEEVIEAIKDIEKKLHSML